MVRTRSRNYARDDSVVQTQSRADLGSHPSGDLHVPSHSRVTELTDVIAHLSPRKPGARIFDLIDRAEAAGDLSTYGTPPDSPTPDEHTFEAMGTLDFEFQLPPAEDPPGLNRSSPPIDFAQAHEWRLGRIDEAALSYEEHDISGDGSRARRREAFAETSGSRSEASPRRRLSPDTASPARVLPSQQQPALPEEVPLPEDSPEERESPERADAASDDPAVKIADPTVPAYDPTQWQLVTDGTHLIHDPDQFALVEHGAPALQASIPVPPLVSGPKFFPPWFLYYTSGDHSIKFEPWSVPQPARSFSPRPSPLRAPLRITTDLPSVFPIVEEPSSDDDLPDLRYNTDSSDDESPTTAYPPSFSEPDPVIIPAKGFPVWGPVGLERKTGTEQPSPAGGDRDKSEPLADSIRPLTWGERTAIDKILRVYDGDGIDAAIAYICNSHPRIEPDLANAWVQYLLDVRQKNGTHNPKIIRTIRLGKWPGSNPPAREKPLRADPLPQLDSPPRTPDPPQTPEPPRKRPRATVEDWDDERDEPASFSSSAKGKGVDPRERSSSTPRSVHFSPTRTSSPPPYQSESSRVFSMRSFRDTPRKEEADGMKPKTWHERATAAATSRDSPRAEQAPPGGYYSESGGLGEFISILMGADIPLNGDSGGGGKGSGNGGGGKKPPRGPPPTSAPAPADDPGSSSSSDDEEQGVPRKLLPVPRHEPQGDYYQYRPGMPPGGSGSPFGGGGPGGGGPDGNGPGRGGPGGGGPGGGGPSGPGSFFGVPDDDGDDGSSDDEPEDAATRERKRREREIRYRRKIASQMKIKQPRVYDGRADLDFFDQWCFEVDLWRTINALDTSWAIPMMTSYLSDKAARFFMNSVIMSDERWDFRKLYDSLFDHCFPADFKLLLRKRFAQARQGQRSVREFARDLKIMACRFPDVSERQLIQVLFEGVHNYIRQKWHEFRYNVDEHTYDELVLAAEHFEKGERARTGEDKSAKLPARWTGNRGPADQSSNWRRRNDDNTHQVSAASASVGRNSAAAAPAGSARAAGSKEKSAVRSNAVNVGGRSSFRSRGTAAGTRGGARGSSRLSASAPQRRDTLSDEELSRLRAEGKCFLCKEHGHIARNCPSRQRARRPAGIAVGSARVIGDDVLQTNALQLNGMRLTIQNPENDFELYYAPPDVLSQALLAMFRAYYSDIYDSNGNIIIPLDRRFEVTVDGYDKFTVRDWAIGEQYSVLRSDFREGNVSVPQILEAHPFRNYRPRQPSITSLARLVPDSGEDNPAHFPSHNLVYSRGEFHLVDSPAAEQRLGLSDQRHVVLRDGGTLYVRDTETGRSYHVTPEQLAAGIDIQQVVAQGLPSHGEHHSRYRPTRDYRTLVEDAERASGSSRAENGSEASGSA
ncbi:hypothetical protein AURDEDRAFT_161632 [Auricularia subglabra TFB-10046 SS5]|nr:hypothetical protein AURDEDRAFT_161632 [Auricularia subglabra TFB-10046 SS5]